MMNTIYAFHLRYPYLALMLLFSALHARGAGSPLHPYGRGSGR